MPPKSFIIRILLILFIIPACAQVGIGTTDPKGALHVYEGTGSPASATKGSIILEHNNNGGSSSIIFKSKSNTDSDYGYINYSDNGSGDATTTEKSLLTIGVENDAPGIYEDNINIAAKGSLGINNINPNGSASIDMGQTDRGILINRVNINSLTAAAPVNNPATGLMVFNTNTIIGQGFHYWNGTRWVRINDNTIPSDNTNLATDDLTQDLETRTYNMNNQDLNFTNGSFGLNKTNPAGTLDAENTLNEDAFRFVQVNNLTGEKDVFTVEDQDVGGGSQDHSSVVKVLKSGAISTGDDGFSLIELANTSTDPGANKYWISGRKADEGAPLWGVDITDSDYWSQGGIQLGVTTNGNGTYSGGNFIVKTNGDTGIGTINPNPSAQLEMAAINKGLLMNRIALTSRGNAAPVTTPAVGLMVYNTATARTDFNKVLPGFYYWDGVRWNPLQKKHSSKYMQTAQVIAPATLGSYIDIPNLTQSFVAPETGKYQIIVNGTYAAGELIDYEIARNFTANTQTKNTGAASTGTAHTHSISVNPTTSVSQLQQGFGEASYRILLDGTKLGERILVANSITVLDPGATTPTNHFALGESTQIAVNVNLIAGQTYIFKVQGKEWSRANTQPGTFGVDTGGFQSSAGENNALRSDLIINFIE